VDTGLLAHDILIVVLLNSFHLLHPSATAAACMIDHRPTP
jgi:hypothetical protein